jgi:hypothetical protein
MPSPSSSKAGPKSPRKSPARTPKKSPGRSPGRSARISKAGTPTSALRLRKSASLAQAFEEAELVAAEQQSGMEVDAGVRPNDGREAPKLVDFKSPPRAVFTNAAEARSARLKSRTSCLNLSDKGAFVHVERLGCHPPPRFQGYEASDPGHVRQPVPMRSATPSPTPSVSPINEPGLRPGLAGLVGGGADHLRPLSRQSSLNSIAWGSISGRGSSLGCGRSAVETPPCAPGAFEASELHGLCRAPLAQNRMTSPFPRRPIGLVAPFPRPVAVAAVATAAPFPRRVPVLGEFSLPPPRAEGAGHEGELRSDRRRQL